MADRIEITEFSERITELIQMELLNAEDSLEEVMSRRARQLKGKLNHCSPKETGDYASGWRVKTVQRNHEKVRVIYNAAKPSLTHILEYGTQHQPAQPHIRPAMSDTIDDMIDELASRI